jgi:hypothetical protein
MGHLRGCKHLKVTKKGIGIIAKNGEMQVGDTVERLDDRGGVYRAVIRKTGGYGSFAPEYYLGTQLINIYTTYSAYNSKEYNIVKRAK